MTKLLARDVMTRNVMMAYADWSLERLADFFVDNYITGALVADKDDELIGVVSVTDIVRHHSVQMSNINSPPEYYIRDLESQYTREEIKSLRIEAEPLITVRDIMTPVIFDVSEDMAIQEVADTMIRGHIHRVFVTQEKKIVGIITALDMVKVVRDL